MNSIKVDLLSPIEKDMLAGDVHDLFNDEQIRVKIILRKRGSQSFSPTTGIMSYTWTNTETYAIKGIFSTTEMPSGKGMGVIEFGDFYFLIPEKEITSLPLDNNDRILGLIYSSGSVSVTKGSKSVSGDGAEWSSYIGKGDYFKLQIEPVSYLNEIVTVGSNSALTLMDNYSGETKTNQQHEVYREYMLVGSEIDTFSGIIRKYICREIK